MKTVRRLLLVAVGLLTSCNSTSKLATLQSAVRDYNGTASVGDFLTTSIDSTALNITYKNYTNGETSEVGRASSSRLAASDVIPV